MDVLFSYTISFITLTLLEIVLGIDNLIFLSIIIEKLPRAEQKKVRALGLGAALIMRIMLLWSAVYLSKIVYPLFTIQGLSFSLRDLLLFSGGVFLLTKATQEIYQEIELQDHCSDIKLKRNYLPIVIIQIVLLDLVFSLDSIFTAIGLTDQFFLMAAAIFVSILAMLFLSHPLSAFVSKHKSIKMLALSFLILIAVVLIADSFSVHFPRGYVYSAMAFSIFVEILNILSRKKAQKSN